MFRDKCHAVNFFWGRKDRPNIHVDQKSREAKNTSHGSQIQIGSKSAHKHVRTDTDRAAGLIKNTRNVREVRQSSLPVYQTTAAGVTNAHRTPGSVEPQQQIQRIPRVGTVMESFVMSPGA
jgi:hypothetical protein